MLVSFFELQGVPKGTPGRPFGIIFGTFCMTWLDDLSRLLAASNFKSQTTLQTPKSLPGQLLEVNIIANVSKNAPRSH